MTQQTFQFAQDRADQVIQAWAGLRGASLAGTDAQQGLMGLLVKAEKMAQAAGWAETDASGQFPFIVGASSAAAQKLAATGDQRATVYLAVQQIVRRSQAEITAAPAVSPALATGSDAELSSFDVTPALAPLAIAAIAIAIAAVAAMVAVIVWSDTVKVQVQGQTQQRLQLVNAALDAASSPNPNVANNPELWKFLQGSAQSLGTSEGFPWGTLLLVGGAVVAGKLIYDRVTA